MTTHKITYGELQNGDQIYLCGYLFTAENVRNIGPVEDSPGIIEQYGLDVIRFTGRVVDGHPANEKIKGTGYDGGTYGGRCKVAITVRRADTMTTYHTFSITVDQFVFECLTESLKGAWDVIFTGAESVHTVGRLTPRRDGIDVQPAQGVSRAELPTQAQIDRFVDQWVTESQIRRAVKS
jgi:hypothetical protein